MMKPELRFDRQLRLWGEEGQYKLMRSRAIISSRAKGCVLGSVSREFGRLLALAGIGRISLNDCADSAEISRFLRSLSPTLVVDEVVPDVEQARECQVHIFDNPEEEQEQNIMARFRSYIGDHVVIIVNAALLQGVIGIHKPATNFHFARNAMPHDAGIISRFRLPLMDQTFCQEVYGDVAKICAELRWHGVVEELPWPMVFTAALFFATPKQFTVREYFFECLGQGGNFRLNRGETKNLMVSFYKSLNSQTSELPINHLEAASEGFRFAAVLGGDHRSVAIQVAARLEEDAAENLSAHDEESACRVFLEFVEREGRIPIMHNEIPDFPSSTSYFFQLKKRISEAAARDRTAVLEMSSTPAVAKIVESCRFWELVRPKHVIEATEAAKKVRETVRCETGKVHPLTATILGSIACTEAIKLLISRWTPVLGHYYWDGYRNWYEHP